MPRRTSSISSFRACVSLRSSLLGTPLSIERPRSLVDRWLFDRCLRAGDLRRCCAVTGAVQLLEHRRSDSASRLTDRARTPPHLRALPALVRPSRPLELIQRHCPRQHRRSSLSRRHCPRPSVDISEGLALVSRVLCVSVAGSESVSSPRVVLEPSAPIEAKLTDLTPLQIRCSSSA